MKNNSIQVEKFLKGLDYPVQTQELVKYAQQHGADEQTIAMLKQLPNRSFDGPASVSKAIGETNVEERWAKRQ